MESDINGPPGTSLVPVAKAVPWWTVSTLHNLTDTVLFDFKARNLASVTVLSATLCCYSL